METHNPTKKAYRSIGAFLCHHPTAPPFEDVDRPSPLDVKQEAALRAVIALRKLGKEIADDAVAAFDAEPKLVALTYRWATRDAHKRQLGRGREPRPQMAREWDEAIHDPLQEASLEAIEDDFAGEVRRLHDAGIAGLSLEQTRRLLGLMRHIQEAKDHGTIRLPSALRQWLCRLRRETRLPLDITLL
jgi:hypothetical protein